VIDDVVERFEDSVRQPVLPHELPDIFLGIEFWRARRQGQERQIVGNLEIFGAMPAGLVEDQDRVSATHDPGSDLIEMKLHGLGVAERENEGGAGSVFGAYRTEQIGRLSALIMRGSGARARSRPTISELVLLANPHLVLEPDLYWGAGRELGTDFRHAYGKVFLNASMASGSCL